MIYPDTAVRNLQNQGSYGLQTPDLTMTMTMTDYYLNDGSIINSLSHYRCATLLANPAQGDRMDEFFVHTRYPTRTCSVPAFALLAATTGRL